MAKTHCWKDKTEFCYERFGLGSKEYIQSFEDGGATCMLWAGHEGKHVFTPDDKIGVMFSETDKQRSKNMTTLKEKLDRKIAEGFETARFCIRAKVGESKMLCSRSSIYYDELRDRARLLEASIDQVEDELTEFQILLVAEPVPSAQVEINLGDVVVEPQPVSVNLPALLPPVEQSAKKKRGRKND